jgi:hypothetical protein
MGYIHKLKPSIISFVQNEKLKFPDLSCRNLAIIASKKFKIKLSKSSINVILKRERISSPVGRRNTTLFNLQGEIEHGGFSLLQGVDFELGISGLVADLFVSYSHNVSKKVRGEMDSIVQALIIFKTMFDINIDKTRCYKNKEIWTLIGRRPTRSVYNQVMDMLLNTQLSVEQLFTETKKALSVVSGYRFLLQDNTSFFIDAEMLSLWPKSVSRRNIYSTYYKTSSYVDRFLQGDQVLSVFNLQGTDHYSQEFINFLFALDDQSLPKRIKQIELIDLDGKVLETRPINISEKRLFLIGLWPWQIELASEFEKKPANKKLFWGDLDIGYHYQIEEVIMPQLIVNKELKYNIILLKDTPTGAIRMGLLTNIPSDVIHNYLNIRELYHWISPEGKYKDFMKRSKEEIPINVSQARDLTNEIKPLQNEKYLDQIFGALSQIIFSQFKVYFIPSDCKTWNALKLKDIFLRQRAIIKRNSESVIYNILISNELSMLPYLEHICQRLNSHKFIDNRSKIPYFKAS